MSARVIVCGSRSWNDRGLIADTLHDLALEFGADRLTIVHGGAKGADRIAHEEAEKGGLAVEVHLPRYDLYGSKSAPLNRNAKMATLGADMCVAFWDGRSTGTAHMMSKARERGIQVREVRAALASDAAHPEEET